MSGARSLAAVTAGLLTALTALTALTGCGTAEDADDTLTVLAAASLTDVFEELAARFEDEHPGVEVRLSFGSSTTLAQQVHEGAPADMLATADEESMAVAVDAVGESTPFATNEIVLVSPAGDDSPVTGLDDLRAPDVDLVMCVPSAPCGVAAATVLDEAGVLVTPRSLELDVRAVLAKVVAGEADAGLVYASDAEAAGSAVRSYAVTGSADVRNVYSLAVVEGATSPDLAEEFADLVTGEDGAAVLRDAGFGAAP